jgi:SAM-dependent methyltransferase
MDAASWQRKNSIVSLPQRSFQLIRNYHEFLQSRTKMESSALPGSEEILKRVQKVVSHASNADGVAEYRCLETGGFLLPTVSRHPCYKSLTWRQSLVESSSSSHMNVLDLGCGLGADGRQMLVDGFATHVVGVDRSNLYLRLGCELFGDDPDNSVLEVSDVSDKVKLAVKIGTYMVWPLMTFLYADIAAGQCDENDDVVSSIQMILQKQQQGSQGQESDFGKGTSASPPLFSAVYAGKFLHCLETEYNLNLVLRRVWWLLSNEGCLFGVYGRNYRPPFTCSGKEDFQRVLEGIGFELSMMEEEAAGATWFCAYKKTPVTIVPERPGITL